MGNYFFTCNSVGVPSTYTQNGYHQPGSQHLQQVQRGLHLVREEGRDGQEELQPLRDVPLPAEAVRGRGHQQGRFGQQRLLLHSDRPGRCHAPGLRLRPHGRRHVEEPRGEGGRQAEDVRSMDLKATGVITFDEWLKFCQDHILAKTATMTPHPMIDTGNVEQYKTFIKAALGKVAGPEHVELYWYMLEIFTDHDTDKDGIVKQAEFSAMMNEFLATPKKLGLPCPAEAEYPALFQKYDPRKDGKMTVDEWMSLATEEVFKKIN